jgi:hypothetical protein
VFFCFSGLHPSTLPDAFNLQNLESKTCPGFVSTHMLLFLLLSCSLIMSDEDPSTMTIEFLRARLQSQRAEYRAEKRRAQALAHKV